MKVTNSDLSVAIVEALLKKGLIKIEDGASAHREMFEIETAIEDVLDNLLPYNREHR